MRRLALRQVFRRACIGLCVLAFAGCSPAVAPAAPTAAPSATRSVQPASASPSDGAGQTVDIGGLSLYLQCEGSGSPAVILESGLGGDHRTWGSVQPEVAESAKVCAYDRANVPPSDSAPTPRTAADAVAELHDLLDAAQIERPIVLVGLSIGGLITQLYAATYPDEVAGLVLVESNHPDEWDQFSEHLTPEQIAADREFSMDNPEGLDPYTSFEEAKAAGPPPEVPLIVITARNATGEWPPDWDAELFDRLRAEQQADLAALVPDGRQLFADESGHHVPSEQPEVIIEAVLAVLEQARGQ